MSNANIITRRNLFKAAPALALVCAPVYGAAIETTEAPVEHGGLLAVRPKLEKAARDYERSKRKVRAIEIEFGPQWPTAPDSLTMHYRDDYAAELAFNGLHAQPDYVDEKGRIYPRPVRAANQIAADIKDIHSTLGRKRKDMSAPIRYRGVTYARDELEAELGALYRVLADAEKYEADKANVLKKSGYEAAKAKRDKAHYMLEHFIHATMQLPNPRTLEGLAIKASAVSHAGKLPAHVRMVNAAGGR